MKALNTKIENLESENNSLKAELIKIYSMLNKLELARFSENE
jgi:hypothetical protein